MCGGGGSDAVQIFQQSKTCCWGLLSLYSKINYFCYNTCCCNRSWSFVILTELLCSLVVTGSRGKGASVSDLLLLLSRSLDPRGRAAGRYISTSARTRTRSALMSTTCSTLSKKVCGWQESKTKRDQNKYSVGCKCIDLIDLKCPAVVDNTSLCLFSLQIHQAGGQAGFEERKVSSLVTMWKRSEQDLIWPGGTCLRILLKAAHSVR